MFQIHNSTERSVVLNSVNLMSSGRYRCEVSAEAPSFQTVSDHSDMLVIGKTFCTVLQYNFKMYSFIFDEFSNDFRHRTKFIFSAI